MKNFNLNRFSLHAKCGAIVLFAGILFLGMPLYASTYYFGANSAGSASVPITNTPVPSAFNLLMQTVGTGSSGTSPAYKLNPTPIYWYSDPPSSGCTFPAGTYDVNLWVNQLTGPSPVTVQLELVNADGTPQGVLGTLTQDVSIDPTNAAIYSVAFAFTLPQEIPVNQRFRVGVSAASAQEPTMIFNGGTYASDLVTTYSSCDLETATPTMTPTATPIIAGIVKSESEATGGLGDSVTYTINVVNNSYAITCTDNFSEDLVTNNPAVIGWNGPQGGVGYECNGPADGVTNIGGSNYVLTVSSIYTGNSSCFYSNNCAGSAVVDGSLCAAVDIESGSAEFLWRQDLSSTYQVGLAPGLLSAGVTQDIQIRVITNGSPNVIGSANAGLLNNHWYDVCMDVSGFNITVNLTDPLGLIAPVNFSDPDPNQSFQAGNVGLQSSIPVYFQSPTPGPGVQTATSLFSAVTVITGPTNYLNTDVSDTLPAALTYVSCSGGTNCGAAGQVVNWNTGSVDAGTSKSVTVVAMVAGSCPENIQNLASWNMGLPQTLINSNVESLAISCSNPTSTFTATPTNTATNTATATPLTPVDTSTPTNTPTITPTSTLTSTPTNTGTPTVTPTSTPGLFVWPVPFNPKYAIGGVLKVGFVPSGATMDIYTVSGEKVQHLSPGEPAGSLPGLNGYIYWDGKNTSKIDVSTGIYIYVVENAQKVLLEGKILLLRN